LFYKKVGILLGVCLTGRISWGNHSGRWLWFFGVSFFKRIGEARTKLMGIEENVNGQRNGSMVN